MSNGDDEPADAPEEASADEPADDEPAEEPAEEEVAAPTLPDDVTEESLTEYLDEIDEALEAADTEADLDDVEALLDDAESALEDADLPEPDEDDEDAEDPRETLQARIDEIRESLADARGPYASDVVADIEKAISTVQETEWTQTGEVEVANTVETFIGDVDEPIGVDVILEERDEESFVLALESIAESVSDAGLDADDDSGTIAALVEATDALEAGLDEAEEWDDLEVHEKLQAQGYYDVLGHYKDYPVEWSALKMHEKQGNVDMILLAFDSLQSDFMERHCLEALQNMGKRAATDEAVEKLLDRAGKRDQPAIRILGKMAADEATETLVEYVDEDSNPQLQKVVFKALGEIGATDAVQPLANKLEMEDDNVRPIAARALGLIGDTRAIQPLADTLENDESDDVRAASAWALRQIGTKEALEAVSGHTDERVFIVQSEAQKATDSLDDAAPQA